MGDLLIVLVILPALAVGSWWIVHRTWTAGYDINDAPIRLIPSASRAGANATRLPMAICFTAGSLGCLANLVIGGSPGAQTSFGSLLLEIALVAFLLAIWMLLFAWPRFLVPPANRGEPGWIVTQVHRLTRRNPKPTHLGTHERSGPPTS
jgi:hypothetical protein